MTTTTTDAAAFIAKTLDNAEGLSPTTPWENQEVERLLREILEHLNPDAPEIVVMGIDDGEPRLACPHPECDGDEFYEVDVCERWNPTTLHQDEGALILLTHEGRDGDGFQTDRWICQTCHQAVAVPDLLETEWAG